MPTSAKYGGVHDAATILQCSDKTVRRLVAEGAIPAYRMPGKSRLIRIRLDELEASLRLIPSGAVSSRAVAMSADLGVNVAAQVLDVHHERARIGAGATP